ncbi:uncharacterized protein LOC144345428 [Saccoglossus kowalevskii]
METKSGFTIRSYTLLALGVVVLMVTSVESLKDGLQENEVRGIFGVNVGMKDTKSGQTRSRQTRDGDYNPWDDVSYRFGMLWAILGSTIALAVLVIIAITMYSYKHNASSTSRLIDRRRRRLYEELARNSLNTSFYEEVSSNL